MARLAEIATAEGFDVTPEALELVARRAGGSMRDSQSLFDQLLAFSDGQITAGDVHRLLGTASDDRLIGLVAALIDRRAASALQQLEESLAEGVQLGELVDQVLRYLRDVMVVAAGAEDVGLGSVSADHRPTVENHAKAWGLNTVMAAWGLCPGFALFVGGVGAAGQLTAFGVARLAVALCGDVGLGRRVALVVGNGRRQRSISG
jgi:DNA polymerase-3 subunit gamma/tau